MKSVHKRILCLLLVLLMLPLSLVELAVPTKAAYENTYRNTGDMRADIIGVALTQVGYSEAADGTTKYGVWYGHPTVAWCGVFVARRVFPPVSLKSKALPMLRHLAWKPLPPTSVHLSPVTFISAALPMLALFTMWKVIISTPWRVTPGTVIRPTVL